MVNIEDLVQILNIIALIFAPVSYFSTIRYQHKSQVREIIFSRYKEYNVEYIKIHTKIALDLENLSEEEIKEKYNPKNIEDWANLLFIAAQYNFAGLLIKDKEADLDLIFQLYTPGAIIIIWEKLQCVIRKVRENSEDSRFWEPFEILYNNAIKWRRPAEGLIGRVKSRLAFQRLT